MDLAICSDGSKDGGGERRPGHVSHHTVEVVAEHWVTGDHRMVERERERDMDNRATLNIFHIHYKVHYIVGSQKALPCTPLCLTSKYTVEPPNKGHYGANDFALA